MTAPTNWAWTFFAPDGVTVLGTSVVQHPALTYPAPGLFKTRLIVSAAGVPGTGSITKDVPVTGTPTPNPPTVTITGPTTADTFPTASATLALSGTATDDVAVTSVTWTNDRGGSGTAAVVGTTAATWSVASVTLLPGVNNLTVTAHDGNTLSSTPDTLVVTYTPVAVTPLPPDLMRGFGAVRGAGAGDTIQTVLTAHATQRTILFWARREETALDRCYFTKSTIATPALTESLLAGVTGGTATLRFLRQWSGGTAEWTVPAPPPGARFCVVIKYNTGAPANIPTIKINNLTQLLTVVRQPQTGETPVSNAASYMLGNFPGGGGNLGGDLAKWTIYNRLTSDQDDLDFIQGSNPMTIGIAPVAYHPLAGAANEPDAVTTTNSVVTGTVVQNYGAPAPTTVTLAVSSGDPATATPYQVTATTTGMVNRVEFDVDAVLTRIDSTAPYTLFAAPTLLGPPGHTITARVYADAGSVAADTKTLTVTEPSASAASWLVVVEIDRVATAISYHFYLDGALHVTVLQPATGNPQAPIPFTGADTLKTITFAAVFAGDVEGTRATVVPPRYTDPSASAPQGFREVARAFAGTTWTVTYRVDRKPAPVLSYNFYLDGSLAGNVLQPGGTTARPQFVATFTGTDVTKTIAVEAVYAGGPGPRMSITLRYVAPATAAPTGFQEISRTFTP